MMQTTETIEATSTLSSAITKLVNSYINALGKDTVQNLRALTLETIEPIVLQTVLEHARYNQSKAAKHLGLSRGTLGLITGTGQMRIRSPKIDLNLAK